MKFYEKEIIGYLKKLEDKPYNIDIRNYYSNAKITFPMLTVALIDESNRLTLKGKEKLNYVNFAFEIYAKSINSKSGIDVIHTIEEWLTSHIVEKFGLVKQQSSAPMVAGEDYTTLRKVINFDGYITDEGYIYQK